MMIPRTSLEIRPVDSTSTQRAFEYNHVFASSSASPSSTFVSQNSCLPLQNQVPVVRSSTQGTFDINTTAPSTSGKANDFLKNFNNIGTDHVDRISAKISELRQDIQLWFKQCFEGFATKMMESLPAIISEQLIEAIINVQATQENKFENEGKSEKSEPTAENNTKEEENIEHDQYDEENAYVIDDEEYQFLNEDEDQLNER
ncbi:hypothetical protein TSAR_014174 [Trichomalopsis sarcophagae]|uniref:Uncharacterized protein n=1 Tax=Trichomalopsis sarcophagae TaxID=543379 RepID=A0A232EX14_9HYME|nr:hypothetical protein TSAR_014174 [Trichomalopsis sarcophagae]